MRSALRQDHFFHAKIAEDHSRLQRSIIVPSPCRGAVAPERMPGRHSSSSRPPAPPCPDQSTDRLFERIFDSMYDHAAQARAARLTSTTQHTPKAEVEAQMGGSMRHLVEATLDVGRSDHDRQFVQHLTRAVVRVAAAERLDAVRFTLADRVAAWLTGFGSVLRQLKEVQQDDPLRPGEPNRHGRAATFRRLRRRCLVLLGLEPHSRAVGRLSTARADELLDAMVDELLHGTVRARSGGERAGGGSIPGAASSATTAHVARAEVASLAQDCASPRLSWADTVFLYLTGQFSPAERALIRGRAAARPPPVSRRPRPCRRAGADGRTPSPRPRPADVEQGEARGGVDGPSEDRDGVELAVEARPLEGTGGVAGRADALATERPAAHPSPPSRPRRGRSGVVAAVRLPRPQPSRRGEREISTPAPSPAVMAVASCAAEAQRDSCGGSPVWPSIRSPLASPAAGEQAGDWPSVRLSENQNAASPSVRPSRTSSVGDTFNGHV